MEATIVVEYLPRNPQCRRYHMNAPAPKWPAGSVKVPLLEGDETTLKNGGDTLTALVRRIVEIDGVAKNILIGSYELWISIGRAFDWSEVEPKILAAIQEVVFPDRGVTLMGDGFHASLSELPAGTAVEGSPDADPSASATATTDLPSDNGDENDPGVVERMSTLHAERHID